MTQSRNVGKPISLFLGTQQEPSHTELTALEESPVDQTGLECLWHQQHSLSSQPLIQDPENCSNNLEM